jgi:hypothetical protein
LAEELAKFDENTLGGGLADDALSYREVGVETLCYQLIEAPKSLG